jgi:hypothetical protein
LESDNIIVYFNKLIAPKSCDVVSRVHDVLCEKDNDVWWCSGIIQLKGSTKEYDSSTKMDANFSVYMLHCWSLRLTAYYIGNVIHVFTINILYYTFDRLKYASYYFNSELWTTQILFNAWQSCIHVIRSQFIFIIFFSFYGLWSES